MLKYNLGIFLWILLISILALFMHLCLSVEPQSELGIRCFSFIFLLLFYSLHLLNREEKNCTWVFGYFNLYYSNPFHNCTETSLFHFFVFLRVRWCVYVCVCVYLPHSHMVLVGYVSYSRIFLGNNLAICITILKVYNFWHKLNFRKQIISQKCTNTLVMGRLFQSSL